MLLVPACTFSTPASLALPITWAPWPSLSLPYPLAQVLSPLSGGRQVVDVKDSQVWCEAPAFLLHSVCLFTLQVSKGSPSPYATRQRQEQGTGGRKQERSV